MVDVAAVDVMQWPVVVIVSSLLVVPSGGGNGYLFGGFSARWFVTMRSFLTCVAEHA